MPQTNALANLSDATKSLFRMLASGEVARVLTLTPREDRPNHNTAKQLSEKAIDDLMNVYAEAKSIYVVAERFGIHRNTVAAHLKSRGVKLGHQPLDEDETQRALQLLGRGLSPNAVGAAMGRDPKTIRSLPRSLDTLGQN